MSEKSGNVEALTVHRNEAGQLSLRCLNGEPWDMSAHVGKVFAAQPPQASPAAAAVAGEPVASQLADKLQELCDVVHEGRLVPDSDASLGYVHSAVEAAEAALTAYRLAHNAGPELVAVLASIVECHEVESGWVSDAHIDAARIAISRATKAAPHPSPSAAEQAERWVPVEPTQAMMHAGLSAKGANTMDVWRAMLAAAPSASPAEAPAAAAEQSYPAVDPLTGEANGPQCCGGRDDCDVREYCAGTSRIYREKCPDGGRCIHGCHNGEPCYGDRNRPATPAGQADMVSVCKDDANNYSRILTVLGMEEEGDPVAEVQRLLNLASVPPAGQAAAGVQGEATLTEDQIRRHMLNAGDCPPQSKVMLVSGIRRLLARAANPAPAVERAAVTTQETPDEHR